MYMNQFLIDLNAETSISVGYSLQLLLQAMLLTFTAQILHRRTNLGEKYFCLIYCKGYVIST